MHLPFRLFSVHNFSIGNNIRLNITFNRSNNVSRMKYNIYIYIHMVYYERVKYSGDYLVNTRIINIPTHPNTFPVGSKGG